MSLHYAEVPAQPWPELEQRWLPRLPPARSRALRRLRVACDRNASLLGIALLAQALTAFGVAFEPGALRYPRRGKPHLAHGPDFSIAHSGALVACAVAGCGNVGVDLEMRAAVRAQQLRLLLDTDERARIARGQLAAADAWVMKEAVVKAAGLGIGALARVRLIDGTALLDGRTFELHALTLVAGYAAWLALDRAGVELAITAHTAREFAALPRRAADRRMRGS